jgi:phosphatidylserine decarboxylase
MALPIEKWVDTAVAKYQELDLVKMSNHEFFRDPPRPQLIDRQYFFAPADGVIIYQKEVLDCDVVEVKGTMITLADLMQDKGYCQPALVVGTFMTFYDVHVNRMSMGGFLKYNYLAPVTSRNLPMLWVEKNIIDKGRPDYDDLMYLKKNERVLNEVYVPHMKYTYFMVQIADVDVDAITPFDMEQNQIYTQNQRFSMIRWGSQVDLILPLDPRYKFTLMNSVTDHVKAGLDRLVKVERVKK